MRDTVSWVYDGVDRRVAVIDASLIEPDTRIAMSAYGKGTFTYTYDQANRQVKVETPQFHTTTMAYDEVNRLILRQSDNGALTTQTYDPVGNIDQITNRRSLGVVSQLTYTTNKANQRIQEQEADGTVTTWTYDRTYQLVNENRAGGPTGTSFNVTHAFDPAGNRIQQNDGTTITTFTYSAANRITLANAAGNITTYTYDLAGNRTSEITTSESSYYSWNAGGQMASAETPSGGIVTFIYNTECPFRGGHWGNW